MDHAGPVEEDVLLRGLGPMLDGIELMVERAPVREEEADG